MNRYIELTICFKNGITNTYNAQLTDESKNFSDDEVLKRYKNEIGESFNTTFKEDIKGYFSFHTIENAHVHIRLTEIISIAYKIINK